MFTPADVDLLEHMVGHERFKNGYPEALVKEYNMRAGMLSRCGVTGGLGPQMLMQLLRDFQLDPVGKPVYEQVSDWRDVEPETVIYYRGDRGVFKSVGSDGNVFIKLDGRKSQWEVNRADVKMRAHEGPTPEEDPDPDDQPVVVESDDEPIEPTEEISEADRIFQEWVAVEPGTKVMAKIDGQSVEAEFIDVEGSSIELSVPTGVEDEYEAVTVPASQVQLPIEA